MLKYTIVCISLALAWPATGEKTTVSAPEKLNYMTSTGLTESQKVERLIQYIRSLKNATFIRNGSEHTCSEAAKHLQSKWEKHKDDIKSAKGFIEEIASRSGLSGQDYKVRFADGTVLTTNEVLLKELKRLEGK
jgi:hypothetical protein